MIRTFICVTMLIFPLTLAQHTTHNPNSIQMDMSSNDMLADLKGKDLELAFLSMMIEHHKGAVEMANWILDLSTNPDITKAAEAIVVAQDPEIKQMTQWLQDWYAEGIDEASAAMMKSEMDTMMQDMGKAENPEKAFLYQMSLHHNSAIDMAQVALLNADHAELRELAKNIIMAQTQEIAQYQEWLKSSIPTSQENSHSSQGQHASHTPSPYVDQLESAIRGLSQEEIDGLLAGEGLGYARSAELNGYPGPRHVLDMGSELKLNSEQTTNITTIFESMKKDAIALGQEIVDTESLLSQSFSDKTISEEHLQTQLEHLTSLYSKLRQVHLQAHLSVTSLLNPEQLVQYQVLRGYVQN